MKNTTTRRVGVDTLGAGWIALPADPEQARDAADVVLGERDEVEERAA